MGNDVLVFVEQRRGVVHPSSWQALAAARQLAKSFGGQVQAGIIGQSVAGLADKAASYGAAKVYLVEHATLEHYSALCYTRALCAAIDAAGAKVVLLGTTFMSRDLAPRVAARRRAALATDCVQLETDGDALCIKRHMYCNKTLGEFRLAPERLQIVSIRTNAYQAGEPAGGVSAVIEPVSFSPDAGDQRCRTTDIVRATSGVKDVTEADIVVSGGRSLKSEENFRILYDLAELVDGAVGASRAACDAGYQPHSRQVGLTGKVVTPRLYLAFGIDGAIQHLAGMRGSKVIVAVNTKAAAPIFKVATYGCVADLFVMVPLITKQLQVVLQSA